MAEKTLQKLTFRHAAFVAEYLKDYNLTGAYRRVYHVSGHSAEASASRLGKHPAVRRAIQAACDANSARIEAEAEAIYLERCAPRRRSG